MRSTPCPATPSAEGYGACHWTDGTAHTPSPAWGLTPGPHFAAAVTPRVFAPPSALDAGPPLQGLRPQLVQRRRRPLLRLGAPPSRPDARLLGLSPCGPCQPHLPLPDAGDCWSASQEEVALLGPPMSYSPLRRGFARAAWTPRAHAARQREPHAPWRSTIRQLGFELAEQAGQVDLSPFRSTLRALPNLCPGGCSRGCWCMHWSIHCCVVPASCQDAKALACSAGASNDFPPFPPLPRY